MLMYTHAKTCKCPRLPPSVGRLCACASVVVSVCQYMCATCGSLTWLTCIFVCIGMPFFQLTYSIVTVAD